MKKGRMLKIGIFCTSDPLVRSKKETDYSYLKQKGFEVIEQDQVRKRTGHTAGSIQERVEAISELLQDESVDILMAYWGGANTNQILPHLDYDLFKKFPKPIVGFSDTSALLLAVNKLSGIKTYMGPAGITFDKPQPFDYTFDYFCRTIVNQEKIVEIQDSPTYADDLYFLRKDSDHRIINDNGGRKVFKEGKAEIELVKFFEEYLYMPVAKAANYIAACIAGFQNRGLNSSVLYAFAASLLLLLVVRAFT